MQAVMILLVEISGHCIKHFATVSRKLDLIFFKWSICDADLTELNIVFSDDVLVHMFLSLFDAT